MAWMNFDYETLKLKCSNTLYMTYKMQLKQLEQNNEQNIMENIKYLDAYVTNATIQDNQEIVKIILKVAFKDYIINKTTKRVIRGNNTSMMIMIYELEFMSTIDQGFNNTCPNCGHVLEKNKGRICKYCGTLYDLKNHDWILTKIRRMIK